MWRSRDVKNMTMSKSALNSMFKLLKSVPNSMLKLLKSALNSVFEFDVGSTEFNATIIEKKKPMQLKKIK